MRKEKVKVYTYTRVSTAMQIDVYLLDAQKARMKAFAKYNGYEIAGEYEDAGKSRENHNRNKVILKNKIRLYEGLLMN